LDKSSSGLFEAERQRELLPTQPEMNSPARHRRRKARSAPAALDELADENHARQHSAQMRGVGNVVDGENNAGQRKHCR